MENKQYDGDAYRYRPARDGCSAIHVFALTNLENRDLAASIIDLVDDSEIAPWKPKAVLVASQFFRPMRS